MAPDSARHKVSHRKVEEGLFCPICHLLTGRLIRGKIYCGNCGFIES